MAVYCHTVPLVPRRRPMQNQSSRDQLSWMIDVQVPLRRRRGLFRHRWGGVAGDPAVAFGSAAIRAGPNPGWPRRRRPRAARPARWSGWPSVAPCVLVAAGPRGRAGPAGASTGNRSRDGPQARHAARPVPSSAAMAKVRRRKRYSRSSCRTATRPFSSTWSSRRRMRRRAALVGDVPRCRSISEIGQPGRALSGRGTARMRRPERSRQPRRRGEAA
jgi:hypothetical protein